MKSVKANVLLMVFICFLVGCGSEGIETGNPSLSQTLTIQPRNSDTVYKVKFDETTESVTVVRSTKVDSAVSSLSLLNVSRRSVFRTISPEEIVGGSTLFEGDTVRVEADFSEGGAFELESELDESEIVASRVLLDGVVIDADIYADAGLLINDIYVNAGGKLWVLGTQEYTIVSSDSTTAPTSVSKTFMARFLNTGELDESFGNEGVVLEDFSLSDPYVRGLKMKVEDDESIFVVGDVTTASNSDGESSRYGYIARFDDSGAWDQDFGDEGLAELRTSTGSLMEIKTSAAGDIFVCGQIQILKFSSAGVQDEAFGIDLDPLLGVLESCDVDSGGAIYAALNNYTTFYTDVQTGELKVRKFTSAGNADSTFGSSGTLAIEVVDPDQPLTIGQSPTKLSLLPSGSMIVTGVISDPITEADRGGDYFIVKITSAGALDSTFGDSGIVNESVAASTGIIGVDYLGYLYSVVDSDGTIYIARDNPVSVDDGETAVRYDSDIRLLKHSSLGVLDETFHDDGYWDYDNALSFDVPPRYSDGALIYPDGIYHPNDYPTAMIIGEDGNLYLGVQTDPDFQILKYE